MSLKIESFEIPNNEVKAFQKVKEEITADIPDLTDTQCVKIILGAFLKLYADKQKK